MKDKLPRITQEGKSVEVLSVLGNGGAKTVLDVSVDGLKRAIAIPNSIDPESIRDTKWQKTLEEPQNAAVLRGYGLLVNPSYQVEKMFVDGDEVDTLSMEPFSELPFEVFDGKDGSKTWENGPLSYLNDFRELGNVLKSLSPDIKKLAEKGVSLKSDSISFAFMPDGTIRLFLYDLDGMTFEDNRERELAEFYARTVVNKVDNILDYQQGRRFDQEGYDLEERQKLAEQLVA